MTRPNAADARCAIEAKLPRRDWILLPILGVLTMCLLAGLVELRARRRFGRIPTAGESCLAENDPSQGVRGIPNCVVWEKIPEGKLIEYRFNGSGYRNNADLGPKPPGTYRIVIVGTSIAAGFRVSEEQTMAALLPAELSRRSERKIEIYNEGLPLRAASSLARNFNEVLAADPDMIFWVVSPLDISNPSLVEHGEQVEPAPQAGVWSFVKGVFAKESFNASMATLFSHTRTAVWLKDLMYESPSLYVQSSLKGTDYDKDFLRSESTAEWDRERREFDSSAANVEGQARKAGIPLVVTLVPDRTQAAMISMMDQCPKGFDPYKLGDELRTIIVSHGGTYIDILPEFRTVPNPQLGYFAIDGHPNASGQAMIARFLASKLADVIAPGFSNAAQTQAGSRARQ
jgi:hypothetical protein